MARRRPADVAPGGLYIRLPDYRIYKVFSYSGLNVRETDLYVIVYKPWRLTMRFGIVSSIMR